MYVYFQERDLVAYLFIYQSINVFLVDLCIMSTNLMVLSGANEYFRRYDAFFLPLFPCKLPSFR